MRPPGPPGGRFSFSGARKTTAWPLSSPHRRRRGRRNRCASPSRSTGKRRRVPPPRRSARKRCCGDCAAAPGRSPPVRAASCARGRWRRAGAACSVSEMREMIEAAGADLLRGFAEAKRARATWEAHWRECYDHTLPANEAAERAVPGSKRSNRLFDGTATDAVGQLAASLLAQLTPPWSRWFRPSPGPDVSAGARAAIAEALERAGEVLQSHFDRSNFAMEAHQCYLDLAVAGTASLLFEEDAPGRGSAFRFTAVPL